MILTESQLKNLISRLVVEAETPSESSLRSIDFKSKLSGSGVSNIKIFFRESSKPISESTVSQGKVITSILRGPKFLYQVSEGSKEGINQGETARGLITTILEYICMRAFRLAFILDKFTPTELTEDTVKKLVSEILSSKNLSDYSGSDVSPLSSVDNLNIDIEKIPGKIRKPEDLGALETDSGEELAFSSDPDRLKSVKFYLKLSDLQEKPAYSPDASTELIVKMFVTEPTIGVKDDIGGLLLDRGSKINFGDIDGADDPERLEIKDTTSEEALKRAAADAIRDSQYKIKIAMYTVEPLDKVADHLKSLYKSGNYRIRINDEDFYSPLMTSEEEAMLDKDLAQDELPEPKKRVKRSR